MRLNSTVQNLPNEGYKSFYDERRACMYGHDYKNFKAEAHAYYPSLKEFIERYALKGKRCLEIGSSGGFFQDMVDDYWGTDIAESLVPYYHKPYRVTTGNIHPFEDEMFDAIWAITVHEHIPDLQTSLLEIKRLLKPGGVLFFAPAWQCRPWAAEGYAVRSYSDLNFRGKLIKASIPIRDSVVFRAMYVFPRRACRLFKCLIGSGPATIQYERLAPNYHKFWTSDSDACNSIDPHDAILFFLSHGFVCLSHPSLLSQFFVRTGPLIFQRHKSF